MTDLVLAIGESNLSLSDPRVQSTLLADSELALYLLRQESDFRTLGSEGARESLLLFLDNQQALWAAGRIIPFRYGQLFQGAATIQLISEDKIHWEKQLQRLGPTGELSLFLPLAKEQEKEDPDESSTSRPSGREYLQRRKAHFEAQSPSSPALSKIRLALSKELAHLLDEDFRKKDDDLEWTLLLPKQSLLPLCDRLSTLEPKVRFAGPFPPLSFVTPPKLNP